MLSKQEPFISVAAGNVPGVPLSILWRYDLDLGEDEIVHIYVGYVVAKGKVYSTVGAPDRAAIIDAAKLIYEIKEGIK